MKSLHCCGRVSVASAVLVLATSLMAASPPAAPAKPDVKLTGFIELNGAKRALLLVQDRSCILGEGQTAGSIEVLQIDEKAGHVKIKNSGAEMDLSLARDGIQPVKTAATAPAPAPAAAASKIAPTRAPESAAAPAINNNVIVIGRNSHRLGSAVAASAGNSANNSDSSLVTIGRASARPRSVVPAPAVTPDPAIFGSAPQLQPVSAPPIQPVQNVSAPQQMISPPLIPQTQPPSYRAGSYSMDFSSGESFQRMPAKPR